jgi:tetratricopeptide (TPR) repeat protein
MQRLSLFLALLIIWSCAPDASAIGAGAERRTWQTLVDGGEANQLNQQWTIAECNFRNALIAAEKFGAHSQEVQVSLPRLAACLVLQDKFEEAEPLYKRSIDIVHRLRSENPPVHPDPDSLVWLDDLSDAYQDKAKTYNPQYCMEHCTAIRRAIAPGRHNKLAPALHTLGSLYMGKKDWSHAEACYKEELEVNTNIYGPNDKHDATPLCSLAETQKELKQYTLAEANLERALAIMNSKPRTEDFYINIVEKRLHEIIQQQGAARVGR